MTQEEAGSDGCPSLLFGRRSRESSVSPAPPPRSNRMVSPNLLGNQVTVDADDGFMLKKSTFRRVPREGHGGKERKSHLYL